MQLHAQPLQPDSVNMQVGPVGLIRQAVLRKHRQELRLIPSDLRLNVKQTGQTGLQQLHVLPQRELNAGRPGLIRGSMPQVAQQAQSTSVKRFL
jgi:hypothetical protein